MKWKDKPSVYDLKPIPDDEIMEMKRKSDEFLSQEYNKEKVRGVISNIILRFDLFNEFVLIDEDTLQKVLIKTNEGWGIKGQEEEHGYADVISPGFYVECTGSIKSMSSNMGSAC